MIRNKKLFIWMLILLFAVGCVPDPTTPTLVQPEKTPTGEVSGVEKADSGESKQETVPSEEFDLKGKKFPILLIGIEEQPFTSITKSILMAVEDSIAESQNSKSLFGAEIVLHYEAALNNADSIQETYTRSIKKYQPLIVFMAAPVDEDLLIEINRSRVPVLYFGLGANVIPKSKSGFNYVFWLTPPPDEQMAFFVDQVWNNWDDIRPPGIGNEFRIGYLTWEEPPHNLSLTPNSENFYQSNNYDLILQDRIRNSPNASATNFLLNCIPSGINVLYTDTFAYGPMVLLNDIYSLGLKDFFVTGGSLWSYDMSSAQYLLAPEESEKFFLPLSILPWSEVDHPSILRANVISNKFGRTNAEKTMPYLLALGAMDIGIHVIQTAVEKSGDGDIAATDIGSQLISLSGYFVLNGLFEVDYSNGNRSPKILRLWSVAPGEGWVPVGKAGLVPDLSGNDEE